MDTARTQTRDIHEHSLLLWLLSWAKTLTFFGKLKPTHALSPALSVYCSLPSESVYSDSPKPSVGSVAKGKVLQLLQYLGRNHGLQLGHILFLRQLGLVNYVATVYYRFISELVQTSYAIFGMLWSVLLARNRFIAMVMHSQQPMKLLLHALDMHATIATKCYCLVTVISQ